MDFSPQQWEGRVGPLLPDDYGNWTTRDVIGPRDACWIVHMREMMRPFASFGRPVATDVFLLSVGQSPVRTGTKVGGLPFWPVDREWPMSHDQTPLPFLAQFDFRESKDIIPKVPEDMLLLFGQPNNPRGIVARWQTMVKDLHLVERQDMPVEPIFPGYFGTRWRTDNYPDASYEDPVILPDGSRITDPWFIFQLLGLQIGTCPYYPVWDSDHRFNHVICSMSSIFPLASLTYPFMNRPEPLALEDVAPLYLRLTDIEDCDGFGVVCVALSDTGEPVVLFNNL